jgi:hypothetical protein
VNKNTIELIPNGKKIRVDDRNKWEFIVKKCHHMAYKCVKPQLDSLADGFHTVIPFEWIKLFSPEELEAALSG